MLLVSMNVISKEKRFTSETVEQLPQSNKHAFMFPAGCKMAAEWNKIRVNILTDIDAWSLLLF